MIWVYSRSKANRYYTFCTPECTAAIDAYLDYRKSFGEELKDIEHSAVSQDCQRIRHPSRNFTTRKYASEINGTTLYNDDDLRSNHYLQRSVQYQSNLLQNEIAARKKILK
jgi:hypothetical protein